MKQVITSDFKLGIIAGGQLGKMLAQVASTWDVKTFVMDPTPNCPAAAVCTEHTLGDFKSFDDVYNFGKGMDMVTLEFEQVNVDALAKLKEEGVKVYPDPDVLRIIQDKGLQKQFYAQHNIPTSPFGLYDSADDIREAVSNGSLSIPFVQKARTEGYDGRGVFIVKNEADLQNLLPGASMVEDKVAVEKEIGVIVCRSTNGEVRTFPTVEMEFNPTANLVEFLLCPADVTPEVEEKATQLAKSIIEAFGLEGILAVEMFLDKDNNVLINEVAPRPHNSGHHTIESAFTSQYEQNLRAILGFPLGSTAQKLPSVMINILGEPGYTGPVKYEGLNDCMGVDGINLHIYGKAVTKPFRKMGHATIVDQDLQKAKEKAKYIQQNLKVIA